MLGIIACLALAPMDSPSVRIEPLSDPRRVRVIAEFGEGGNPLGDAESISQDDGERVLRLHRMTRDDTLGPAIFGGYRRESARLFFTPRHVLAPESRYRAVLECAGVVRTAEYLVPAKRIEQAPRIVAIYPSASVLPANQLKFYIHFSKPMREGAEIFDRFHIVDDAGVEVDDPWRRTELWADHAQRLTLWIHPGRIKEGVNLREDLGPVLEPNRSYRLVIDAELRDADGAPLGVAVTKTFRTVAADHARPDAAHWKLTAPIATGRGDLEIAFPEPLDRALAARLITVWRRQTDGSSPVRVEGTVEVGPEERSWRFTPREQWTEDEHFIKADDLLEDLAGNTPARLFDNDVTAAPTRETQRTIQFRPRSRDTDPTAGPG